MSLQVPTFTELEEAGKTEIQAIDPSLNLWTPGSNLDALNGSGAVVADATMAYMLRLIRSRFFALAVGIELDNLALDVFKLTRNTASVPAVGLVDWMPVNDLGGYPIPAGTPIQGVLANGDIYQVITTEDGLSDAGVEITVQAVVAGEDGNIKKAIITTPIGFVADTAAFVVQSLRMAGGADPETDDEFKTRIATYLGSLSKGNNAALYQAAITTPGVAHATLEEVPSGSGMITYLYLSDAAGAGNPALVARAAPRLEEVRGSGTLLITLAAARDERAISIELRIRPNGDVTSAVAAANQVVVAYFDTVPAGIIVYGSKIEALCHGSHRDITQATANFVMLTPAARADSVRISGTLTFTTTS